MFRLDQVIAEGFAHKLGGIIDEDEDFVTFVIDRRDARALRRFVVWVAEYFDHPLSDLRWTFDGDMIVSLDNVLLG